MENLANEFELVTLDCDTLELCVTSRDPQEEECEEKGEMELHLDSRKPYRRKTPFVDLGVSKGLLPPSYIQALRLEGKPLPKNLRYEFLG